jgi:hypothetical protein
LAGVRGGRVGIAGGEGGCRVSWLGAGGSLMGEGGCRVSCLGVGGSLAWEAGCRVSCLGMGRLSGVLGGEGGV